MRRSANDQGVGLLELLLSLAIIGLISGLSLPVYRVLVKKNQLDIATTTTALSLRRAQILSQSVDGDTSWGVKLRNGSLTIFKGASFAGRDTDFDEEYETSTEVSVVGVTEVVYTKFSGLPQTTGIINLSTEGDSRSVSINEKGTITY